MEEYIQLNDENERKKKQEYLIKNIIDDNFDADAFAFFLQSEREDGALIDNWDMEELETMVVLFKREHQSANERIAREFKLESLEVNENAIYVKQIAAFKRPSTITASSDMYIKIVGQEVVDTGIFYGKSIIFSLEILPECSKIRRSESDFKWLSDFLNKEFPTVPIPPLLKLSEKNWTGELLKKHGKLFERFINDCVRHSELKQSIALEAFIKCQSKENLAVRQKEIASYAKTKLILDRSIPKRVFDSGTVDYLKNVSSSSDHVNIKFSQILKQHFACFETQFNEYEPIFERIEKSNLDFEKGMTKLAAVNQSLKESLNELQNASIKANSGKLIRSKSSLVEDMIFGSMSRYFDNNAKVINQMRTVYNSNVYDYVKYMKEYVANVKECIASRKFMCDEYSRARITLSEKKNKRMTLDKSSWEVDRELLDSVGCTLSEASKDFELARAAMLSEVD